MITRVSVRRSRPLAFSAALVALAAVASAAASAGGCSSTAPPSDRPPARVDASLGDESSIADRAVALSVGHGWLAHTLSPNALAWTRDGDAFTSPGWRAADARDNAGVGARWPMSADRPVPIAVGQDPTRTLTLTPLGAAAAPATLDRGRVVFHDAYPSTDVVVGATRERVEALLLLRDAGAPSTFAWGVELSSRIAEARVAADDSLEIVSTRGKVVLRMPRPFAVDAAGVRRDADLAFDGQSLRVSLDVEGLAFPIALDPAMETPLWTNVTPTTSPGAESSTRNFAFDSSRGNGVLFGSVLNDNSTWLWSTGTHTWTKPTPATSPVTRQNAAMAFDSNSGRNVAVLFGGYSGGSALNDLYEWNGTTWAPVCTGTCMTSGPGARYEAVMSYAGASGVLLFSGGPVSGSDFNDTWTWSGTAWTQKCPSTSCTTSPSPRTHAAMTYDSGRGRVVLFGGYVSPADVNETWEFNGTSWTPACTSSCTPPSIREGAVMTYDSIRKKTVLFGGYNSATSAFYGDTWEWDGTTWTEVTAGSVSDPGGRGLAGFGFDATNRVAILFGGAGSSSPYFADTWTYGTEGETCTSSTTCDTNACLDGVCCSSSTCGACYPCDGTSPGICATTPVTLAQTPRCTGTNYCNASGTCQAQGAAGASCTANIQCGSGLTCSSEGVCCNSVCNSDSCHSCLAAFTGAAAGTCSPISSGTGARTGLPTPCTATSQASCGLDGTCNGAGACRDWPASTVCVAESCTGTTQTNSSTCTGSGACNTPTTTACGAGFKCGTPGCDTSCTTGTDMNCLTGYYCVGGTTCVPKLANGTQCTAADQCSTGNCNHDGVCCDQACNGVCQSCTNAKKGSGPDGTCGGTAATTADPSGMCTNSGTTCGAQPICDGTNNGTASCVQHAHAGAVCGATTCTANAQSGLQCDGAGNCASANGVMCAPYDCANGTMCATTCAMDSDCQTGSYCSGAHTCIAMQANGQMCGAAHECTSGLCVDGFCCNGACGEQCQACNVTGKEGTCSPVTGTPVGTRTACTNAGVAPCGGACDGTNGSMCTYAGSTTTCANACSGASNTEETTSSCNGHGACVTGEPTACPNNLLCDSTTKLCKTTCTTSADCAPNYDCDSTSHLCAAMTGAVCDGMHTINAPMEEPQDCTPYNCSAKGCLTSCASPNDCVAPNICDESDHCNLPTAAGDNASSGSSGGCAAAPVATGDGGGACYWALFGLAGVAVRRRKRGARVADAP